MKGKLEQPDLGISTKEYYQIVMNNKRVTRGSVNSFSSPQFPPENPPSLSRGTSYSSNNNKKRSPRHFDHPSNKEKSKRLFYEDHDHLSDFHLHEDGNNNSRASNSHNPSASKKGRRYNQPKQPKPYKFQDAHIEIGKPVKLFSFEQGTPQLRNEYPLGLNLLKHRGVKVMHKEAYENKEKFTFYNGFVAKRNKNDYRHVSIEFLDEKLNHSRILSTSLDLENVKDRSMMMTQDLGIVELDKESFEKLFYRIDPKQLTFDMVKTKNGVVYWPVAILNNCSADLHMSDVLSGEIEDDCDYLREYVLEQGHYEQAVKIDEFNKKMGISKEDIAMFEAQQEEARRSLKQEDLIRVQEDLKEIFDDDDDDDFADGIEEEIEKDQQEYHERLREQQDEVVVPMEEELTKKVSNDTDNIFGDEEHDATSSFGSLEEELQKKDPEESVRKHEEEEEHNLSGPESEDNLHFEDLDTHKRIKTEQDQHELQREQIEQGFYPPAVLNGLDQENSVLIWLVGTGYFQVRKIHEIKPVNTDIKNHLISVSKKSKFLNKMIVHFGKLTRDYNVSTQESDYSLPISNKIIKENLFKVVYLGNEDRALTPMIPLMYDVRLLNFLTFNRIKEKKNENFTIFRVLDDYSLLMMRNNESKTVIKTSSFLPPLDPGIIERLDNVILIQNYNRDMFIKRVLFPIIYTHNLIDCNFGCLGFPHKKPALNKHLAVTDDPAVIRNTRCKQCNYILMDLPHHRCNKCCEYFHDHCVSTKKESTTAVAETNSKHHNNHHHHHKHDKKHANVWVCKSCKSCGYCTANTNRNYLVHCDNCEEAYHTFCIQSLHPNYKFEGPAKSVRFICTECALCQMCGNEIENFSDKNIVEEGLTLCNGCIDVRQNKEYCPMCNKRWGTVQGILSKEDIEMIECQCKMWVHRACDPELTPEIFKEFSLTGRVYHCPNCRRAHKNRQLADFIIILADLDVDKYFAQPVDEVSAPSYRQVITHPMDFETMEKKALNSEYLEDPYNFPKADFDRICENAIIFNMPKTQIYGAAKKMKKFGDKAFGYFKELLECPNKEFLKYSKKLSPNHYAAQFKKEIEEYYYDILYEEKDMNPLTRIRVIDNTKINPFLNNPANPNLGNIRKNPNKEVLIEITGLNYLLADKPTRDSKKNAEARLLENSERKGNQLALEDSNHSMLVESDSRKGGSAYEEEMKSLAVWNKLAQGSGVGLVEELLGQTSKNKPFFYFNPVVIQFTNPGLIKFDICYLCGSFGESVDYLYCSVCQEGYHYFCVSKAYSDLDKVAKLKSHESWQCPKCKLCQKCNRKSETHDCLICETCDNLYHLNCIYPQVGVLLPSDWRCEECFKCSRCGSNKLFSDNLNIEVGSIQPEFCENFKYCYECGLKMAYFKFCKICKKFCQKAITTTESDSRSLAYINPIEEDSVECKMCMFKYHIACYEEEYFPITDAHNFVCYNCKVDDDEYTKIETELTEKAERIAGKRRQVKLLMRICESIFNNHIATFYSKNDHFKENLTKFLFDYIIEDYEFLTQEKHIVTTLENYKLLNTATKLMASKYAPHFAIAPLEKTPHKEVSVAPLGQKRKLKNPHEHLDMDFLREKADLFDFIAKWPIIESPEMEAFYELAGLISIKEKQAEVLPTEASREYYDYIGYVKIRDEDLAYWILLPNEVLYEDSILFEKFSFMSNFVFLCASCVNHETKPAAGFFSQRLDKNLNKRVSQLLAFETLLENNDPYYFEVIEANQSSGSYEVQYLVDEKFSHVVDYAVEPVWAPYWKTIENIRFSLFQKAILNKTERLGILVPPMEIEHDKFAKLFYRRNTPLPVKLIGEIETEMTQLLRSSQRENGETQDGQVMNIEREEDRYYGELKHLMFIEMIAIEIIKRRIKVWFDMKKEATHAPVSKAKAASSTKQSRKYSQNGLYSFHLDGAVSYRRPHNNAATTAEQSDTNTRSIKMEVEDGLTTTGTEPEAHQKNNNVVAQNGQTGMNEESEKGEMPEPDVLLQSPLASIECICCKTPGDRKLSGRLLFVDCDQWVHTNCALWSNNVSENIEGGLMNFMMAYRDSLASICSYCQKSGATVHCMFSRKCQQKYHFNCAFLAKCSFLTNKKVYCKNCTETKATPGMTTATDFTTNRRLYIVRNTISFSMDSSKSSKYIKEKLIEMQSRAFNRIGNLTVISAKKYNSDAKFLINEYALTKILTQQNERKPIFITLNLVENSYHFKFSRIDDSILLSKKTLYAQKTSHEGEEESFKPLESAENFFENLSVFIHNNPSTAQTHISTRERITKKELFGEFLALYSPDVKRWLKSSVPIDEDDGIEKKEYPSFKEYYYSQEIDELDPFKRQEKVDEIYGKIIPKIQNLIQNFNNKEESERLKNPKERSFNKMNKRLKSNKRKTESLGHFDEFAVEETIPAEPELYHAVSEDNLKYANIQSAELENKLSEDYKVHKRGGNKVMVAPSTIHKYGLFALESFNKNEIVIEYCGEIIRNKIADLRENKYKQEGFGDCFMFRADKDHVIDATFKGNQARYLNHSCNPCCSSIILEVDGQPKIVMYANRPIYAGEELTYDYQFDIEAEKIECTCGAKNCQGRLN